MTESRTRPRTPRHQPCAACNRTMYIKGRGLCSQCYDTARHAGHLTKYAEDRVDRQGQVAELMRRGIRTPSAVAAALGISRNSADMALVRVRRKGLVPDVTPPTPLAAFATDPPTRPLCAGEVMDFDGLRPHELTPARNPYVAAGLALCAACPLATRQWCHDVMDPRDAGRDWQGIAGGVVWSHGRVVYMPADVEAAS